MEIKRVNLIKNQLGEGPVWDVPLQSLFWVDSLAGEIFQMTLDGDIRKWSMPNMIGSLAIIDDDRAVVALQTGIHLFSFTTGDLTEVVDPEADRGETRLNDGKTDREGNFIVGSMGIKIRDRAVAALYRLDSDLKLTLLDNDVIVANGPCFSPDGSVFYFNDGRRRILAYDYHPKQLLTNKRVFFDGAEYNTGSDGATVDSDGNLWVALTGSGELGCINPRGELIERISMPVRLPSSVMFGGPNLDELYVTSIHNSGNRISNEPEAGALYRVSGLGATGLPEKRFNLNRPDL